MTFIATTLEGLESSAILETNGEFFQNGRVKFEDFNKGANYLTIEDVYELITSCKFKSLNDILNEIKKLNLSLKKTYKCYAKRKGDHEFNSVTLEQEVGKTLGKVLDMEYSKENPDIIFFLDANDDNFNLGYLKKLDLTKREYRFKLHKQTIPSLIAACLIKKLDIKPNESLLCIDSTDGVIPIEAKLQNIETVFAHDKQPNNIRNSKINSKLAKVDLKYISDSVENLNKLKEVDYVISPIIFSKKKGNPYKKINQIIITSKNLVKKKLAILTNHKEDVLNYIKTEFKNIETFDLSHKGLKLTLIISDN